MKFFYYIRSDKYKLKLNSCVYEETIHDLGGYDDGSVVSCHELC